MFDFSFSEILLCFVVALVVLGPERMPAVARAVGRWTGKARVYMRNLTAELERETQVAELKKQVEDAQRILREQQQSFHTETNKLVEEAKPSLPADPQPPANNG
jgi:sec-independent protein translocase protein TatB